MGKRPKPVYLENGRQQQKLFAELFGQNEYYKFCIENPEGRKELEVLLATTLHQAPVGEGHDEDDIWDLTFNRLSEDDKRNVADWISLIKKKFKRKTKYQSSTSENLKLGIVFISLLFDLFDEGETMTIEPRPLIRLHLPGNELRFIDWQKRVYKSWDHFLKTNEMPKCHFVYPEGGQYHRRSGSPPLLLHSLSSSAKMSRAVVRVFDKASMVAGVLGLGVGLVASTFTPAAPLLLPATWSTIASASWGFTRSSHSLHDLRTHQQTLSLADKRAAAAWLGVGTSIISLGASASTIKSIVKGRAASVPSEQPQPSRQPQPSQSLNVTEAAAFFTKATTFYKELERTVAVLKKGEMTQDDINELMLMHFLNTKLIWPQILIKGLHAVVEQGPVVYQQVVNKLKDMHEEKISRGGERIMRLYEARRAEAERGIGPCSADFSPFIRDMLWSSMVGIFEVFGFNEDLFNRVFSVCLTIVNHYFHLREMVVQGGWSLAVELLAKAFTVVKNELERMSLVSLEDRVSGFDEDGLLPVAERISTQNAERVDHFVYILPVPNDNASNGHQQALAMYSKFLFDDETTLTKPITSNTIQLGGFEIKIAVSKIIKVTISPE